MHTPPGQRRVPPPFVRCEDSFLWAWSFKGGDEETRREGLSPCSPRLSSFISYILFLRRSGCGTSSLCCKALALMHGGGGGIYCSALLEIQMYYYEAGGCMGDVPASRSNPLAPHPQASGCMGAIIVAVNSAAPLRPCLNRPLRMVHYGPCWLQLSRGADLCTVAWRWRGGAMLVYWGSPFLTHWRRRAQVLLLEVKGAVMRSPLLLGAHPSVWAPPPPLKTPLV